MKATIQTIAVDESTFEAVVVRGGKPADYTRPSLFSLRRLARASFFLKRDEGNSGSPVKAFHTKAAKP